MDSAVEETGFELSVPPLCGMFQSASPLSFACSADL